MANAEGNVVDNLTSLDLSDLNEETVIELLRNKYSQNKIYVSELCLFHIALLMLWVLSKFDLKT